MTPAETAAVAPAGITTYHVYPTDCDVFGHVNHATMITLLEHARWALLERVAGYDAMLGGAVWSVVRHVDVSYSWQSVPGDDLVIRSGLLHVGKTSYAIRQTVRHARGGRLHAAATITFVCVDRAGRPVRVPEGWPALFPLWDDSADAAAGPAGGEQASAAGHDSTQAGQTASVAG